MFHVPGLTHTSPQNLWVKMGFAWTRPVVFLVHLNLPHEVLVSSLGFLVALRSSSPGPQALRPSGRVLPGESGGRPNGSKGLGLGLWGFLGSGCIQGTPVSKFGSFCRKTSLAWVFGGPRFQCCFVGITETGCRMCSSRCSLLESLRG